MTMGGDSGCICNLEHVTHHPERSRRDDDDARRHDDVMTMGGDGGDDDVNDDDDGDHYVRTRVAKSRHLRNDSQYGR